jgi:hypothetical protein
VTEWSISFYVKKHARTKRPSWKHSIRFSINATMRQQSVTGRLIIFNTAHIEPGREGLFNLIKGIPPTLRYEAGLIGLSTDSLLQIKAIERTTMSLFGDITIAASGHLSYEASAHGETLSQSSRTNKSGPARRLLMGEYSFRSGKELRDAILSRRPSPDAR